ncbi:cyanophycin synthetase [Sphingobacteriaceae bacterium]|nr:cyanophycin synthetase [Sphingobacteriaceae bacterium]
MKILETKILKGPNFWSNYRHNLIVLKLDIGEYEELPSNKIEGFSERMEAMIPSLFSHRCSQSYEGGFFERVKEGTWMGHIIEHIALEIQCLAGMEAGFGRTRSADEHGVYHVIFSYEIESAGLYAGEAALRIVEHLISGEAYDIANDIDVLKRIKLRKGFGPSTQSLINEARRKNIPVRGMENGSLILLGQGANQKMIRASMTSDTSSWGVEMACDKEETKKILDKAYIPVPKGEVCRSEEGLKEIIAEIGFPVVLKPIDGNHGRGITTNITNPDQAIAAFEIAKTVSDEVIVERYIVGDDYRFLLVNYKLVAVAKRTPAMVMGDGHSSIQSLIDQTNADPNRGEGHEKVMTTIKVDKVTETILKEKNLSLDHILPLGEILFLKDTANISTGGTSTDMTDNVHPANVFMAERIAKLMKLDICGIDIVAKDVALPFNQDNNGAVIEVNACPGFRMHLNPSKGLARNVAEPVIDMLFPEGGKSSRIPIVAITGTNGKTTTTRLISHIAKVAGHKVGYTTTDGIYLQDHLIHYGDCTGSQSAATILTDPTVDFAVLECARGGLLRSGLGFDHCDISIVTNISEDHLGLKGIKTLEEMAKVKSVVPKSTFDHGYAILNADDDLVYGMKDELDCNIAYFSIDATNERIKKHCANGGLAAVVEKGFLTVCRGEWKIRVHKIESIPLTVGGRAECMIKNILPATLAAIIQNFKIEDIRQALLSFIPSPELTPGRMNLFNFKNFDLMIDYAHNTAGFMELKTFMDRTRATKKTGIFTGVGDRRDEDIRNLGIIAGRMFDEVIIRHDKDMRGRPQQEVTNLVIEGLKQTNPDISILVISDEHEAVEHAINHAQPGEFIVVCTDTINESTAYVKSRLQEETNKSNLVHAIN